MPIQEHRRVDIFGAKSVDKLNIGGAGDGVTWPFGQVCLPSYVTIYVHASRVQSVTVTI